MRVLLDGGTPDIERLARPAMFTSDTQPLSGLIIRMQRGRNHCAVVLDEHGTAVGLAFLEDAIEEIVGPIRDEFDDESPGIRTLPGGAIELPGSMALPEAVDVLELDEPEEEADTIGGHVVALLGRLPRRGDELRIGRYRVTVVDVTQHRVGLLRFEPRDAPSARRRVDSRPGEGEGPAMALRMGIVPFWKGYDRALVRRTAQLAEDLGYDSVWVPEAWGYEQFQLLTEIALATKTLRVATGIANVFSRSPGLLAMCAATLDDISEGRAILGLGTSGKLVIENFHGVPYRKPLTRLRETIAIMRTLWSGGRLEPELSTLLDLRHFKLEMTPRRPDIPIYVASLQDKAIRTIGEAADGWLPTFWPYRHLADGIALIEEGARAAGRDPGAIDVAPFLAVIPLDDVNAARSMVKPLVSFYIGGMGAYYHALFCRYGFQENADQVRDLYAAGKRKEAAAAVSDDLIDAIAVCGPAEQCRERLAEWQDAGMGTALLNLPTGMPFEVTEHALRAVAPR